MANGYMVAHLDVHDPEGFEKYRDKVVATVVQYGGKYLVRGGAMDTLEGSELPPRTVIIEFASVEQAKSWYNSPEYQDIIGLRLSTATGSAQIVEGMD